MGEGILRGGGAELGKMRSTYRAKRQLDDRRYRMAEGGKL